jgi:hypothetical protein
MQREAQLCARFLAVLFLLIYALPSSRLAQTGITAAQDQAEIQFPDSLTFSVELQSQTEIQQVTLVYRVQQIACSEVVAKAFPQFTPGKAVTAT